MRSITRKSFNRLEAAAGIACVFLIMICCINPAFGADNSISARYVQPRGDHIRWQIRVPSPAPEAVIVTQYIRPGSEITYSSHPLSSYDRKKGIAKWLLTSISPGPLAMDIKVSKPIRKKGEIHGEVLFKDATKNTTSSIFMAPRTVKKALEGC